jgi:autotransporter-associated beta strand protein
MKPKQPNLIKFLTVCIAPAIAGMTLPSASAATRTWDGGATTNVLNTAPNWSDNLLPNANGDVAEWNGTVAGDLVLTSTAAWTPTTGNTGGTNISVTTGQTAALTLGGNQNIGLGATLTVQSGAGPVTINPTAQMVLRGGNTTITNESASTLTFGTGISSWNNGSGAARTVTFGGAGNMRIDGNFAMGGSGSFTTLTKNGAGTLTFDGAQNGQLAASSLGNTLASIVINEGTMRFGNAARIAWLGTLGTSLAPIANEGTFEWASSASQTLSGAISGGGTISQTAGNLTLTGANSFYGNATITGGTLNVSGTGSLECSITVNGTGAKYMHTSTNQSFQNITLTQGTVGGSGTISAVTAADSATAVIANGNTNSAPLTIDTLTFSGDGALNLTEDGDIGSSGILVTGTLSTTPASGTITVNASNSFWDSGVTYNLVSAGTFSAALSDFTLGTISGVTGRQAPSLVATGSGIGLQISGDNPKWSGLDSTGWLVGSTGANGNWKLASLNTKTDYIEGDVVLFDDSAAGTTVTVAITAADVSPAVVNFSNSKNYVINGPFGIAAGAVNKNGSGNVTISAPNTYNGGTTINSGTITLSGAGTLGATTSALTVTSGSVDLGNTSQTLGALAVSDGVIISNGSLTATGLTASVPTGSAVISSDLDLGAGSLAKSGDGNLTLGGTTAYSGPTTISGGSLLLSGSASLGSSSSVTLDGGYLDLGGTSQFTNAINITAAAVGNDTITNGTITPASFSTNSAAGLAAVVSADITGPTGVTRNGNDGVLSLTGNNTFTGPLNFAGNGTVTIDGGSNTGGGAITYNSFGSTFAVNDGSYLTSGITSNGYSEFRTLNFNGGVLESQGNIFTDSLAISVNFNGGTLKSGSASGITLYDANNQIAVSFGGATLDTTNGNITIGLNTGGTAALANPLARLTGTAFGPITLLGGNSLVSGITNNGYLDIQNNSSWNINGVPSSVGGLTGDGSITSSPGSAVLTIDLGSSETYSGSIGGGTSLVIQGTGIQTLSGNNTYQGDTTVLGGVLAVTGNSLPNIGKLVIDGGVVNLTGSEEVASLFFGAAEQAAGTWGATGSGATNLDDTRFSGTGILNVVPPPAGGYAAWAVTRGLTAGVNDGPNQDPDFDEISNLLEYVLGGLPIGTGSANTSILPADRNGFRQHLHPAGPNPRREQHHVNVQALRSLRSGHHPDYPNQHQPCHLVELRHRRSGQRRPGNGDRRLADCGSGHRERPRPPQRQRDERQALRPLASRQTAIIPSPSCAGPAFDSGPALYPRIMNHPTPP